MTIGFQKERGRAAAELERKETRPDQHLACYVPLYMFVAANTLSCVMEILSKSYTKKKKVAGEEYNS